MCGVSTRKPSRARTTSKLSHTGAQWQRQAAWLSVHCEVPAESALSKASRLVPGAWAAHGFWNGKLALEGSGAAWLGQDVEKAGGVILSAACLLTACQDPATGHLFY